MAGSFYVGSFNIDLFSKMWCAQKASFILGIFGEHVNDPYSVSEQIYNGMIEDFGSHTVRRCQELQAL